MWIISPTNIRGSECERGGIRSSFLPSRHGGKEYHKRILILMFVRVLRSLIFPYEGNFSSLILMMDQGTFGTVLVCIQARNLCDSHFRTHGFCRIPVEEMRSVKEVQ